MVIALRDVYKLTVFVPTEYLEQLLESIISAVPLRFGDYDEVLWFSAPGISAVAAFARLALFELGVSSVLL